MGMCIHVTAHKLASIRLCYYYYAVVCQQKYILDCARNILQACLGMHKRNTTENAEI